MARQKKMKRYCVKSIKGNFYVYSWFYRPRHLRTKRKNQRYYWKYIGRYESATVQKLLNGLSIVERQTLQRSYIQKVKHQQIQQELTKMFEEKEPFKSEKERISKINNRNKYVNEMSQYQRRIRKKVKKHLSDKF